MQLISVRLNDPRAANAKNTAGGNGRFAAAHRTYWDDVTKPG